MGTSKRKIQLILTLKNGSDKERENAAKVLGEIGDAEAIDPLIEALNNDPWGMVRTEAVRALSNFKSNRVHDAILFALKDDYLWTFEAAIEALSTRQDTKTVEALIEALQSDLYGHPERAAEALAKIGDSRAIKPLILSLEMKADYQIKDLIKSLAQFGIIALEPLLSALDHENKHIRDGIISALSLLGDQIIEQLLFTLESEKYLVREGSAKVLGNIGDDRVVEPLINALMDDNFEVVIAALEALRRIGDVKALQPILDLSKNDHEKIQASVAKVLGDFKDPRAIETLLVLMEEHDFFIRWNSIRSLGKMGEPAIEPLLLKFSDNKKKIRYNAAMALGQIGNITIPFLLTALSDSDWRVRQAAVMSLGEIENESVVDNLVRALIDPNIKVRIESANSLGKIGSIKDLSPPIRELIVNNLVKALNDSNTEVRIGSANSLGDIGSHNALSYLYEMLQKNEEVVQQAAVKAILKTSENEKVILRALNHNNPAVRHVMIKEIVMILSEVNVEYDFFPRWFTVMKDYKSVWVSETTELLVKKIAKLTNDPSEKVRKAAVSSLSIIRHKLELKRLKGKSNIHYAEPRPGPNTLGIELDEEIIAIQSIEKDSTRRFADFTFFNDTEDRKDEIPENNVLVRGQPYRLEVAVRVNPTGILPEDTERIPIREPRQQHDVVIYIAIESDDFTIIEPVQTLILPPVSDSTKNAMFQVIPTRKSLGNKDLTEILVRLYYKFNLLEVAVIQAEVVGKNESPLKSKFGLEKPISFYQKRLEQDYHDFDDISPRDMHIDITKREDHFLFNFSFYNASDGKIEFSAPSRLRSSDLETMLFQIRETLQNISMSKTFSQQVEGDETIFPTIRKLARIGDILWGKLFYHQLNSSLSIIGQMLENHPLKQGGIIQISVDDNASDFVFPWALLYDRQLPHQWEEFEQTDELPDLEGFWGIRYIIEQRLPGKVYNTDMPVPIKEKLKLDFILREDFPNSIEHKNEILDLGKKSKGKISVSSPITEANVCYSLLEKCDANILYFYTHGHTAHSKNDIGVGDELEIFKKIFEGVLKNDPRHEIFKDIYEEIRLGQYESKESWIKLQYGRIFLNVLYNEILHEFLAEPLVILNMCESAQIIPSLSHSFIHFFIDRGALSVVGTECPMTSKFAHPFAILLLENVFQGNQIGTALLNARRHFCLELNNPLGLAYTIFGSATISYEPPLLDV